MNIGDVKLKPCPFCGSDPVYYMTEKRPGREDPKKIRAVWEIGCSKPFCFADVAATKWHHYSEEISPSANVFDYVPEHMIEMWNQREVKNG